MIEQGFSDQLTQACQSFTQSLPVKKPKQVHATWCFAFMLFTHQHGLQSTLRKALTLLLIDLALCH